MPKKRIPSEKRTLLATDSDEETGGSFGRQDMPLRPSLLQRVIASFKRFLREKRASRENATLVAGQEPGDLFRYIPAPTSSSAIQEEEQPAPLATSSPFTNVLKRLVGIPSERSNTTVVMNPFREKILKNLKRHKASLAAAAAHNLDEIEGEVQDNHNRSGAQRLL
ncbi:MAG: hypothetical protein ACD_44C00107G0010 [uncultured bacterium]|nr:MAG: hypothetical protein ACD_44C00107G0010 [uncultured bacterium]OGT15670.1 MAG: hypothetical protein A3B69_04770 [Gammaproteobacteria bacterium RIFCSPHIGHO2_02_FULL_38_33]OGT23392.1 MAG: hypothetical protein A2W47_04175 [Gammaproteobacteria bacterium RIFCSPHIGHO2_12_38_15]OGT66847.1 MAG: hypothetical protein A3I12_02170 [Gammaproteobacteria bacterium RIFCSPLOWO2_02_FULL_38_11]OGT75962.1 MAG: hypothetical protein A3G71_04545 [Gammaproteobacteria bacterium RIFCSPLOWO2_12_FULL_38_14]